MPRPLFDPSSDQLSPGGRNHGLDGLRGIAALAVALGHSVLQVGGMQVWASTLNRFHRMSGTDIGLRLLSAVAPSDAAVIVFFVLSGHVLWSSFQRKDFRFVLDLPDYACARLYRLFPVVIASGVLLAFFTAASAMQLAMNMLLLSHDLNGVLWSLQVEVIASFQLFVLWCVVRGSGWKLAAALGLAALGAAAARGNPYVVYLPAFILGALVPRLPGRLLRRAPVIAAGTAMLVLTNIVLGHGGLTRCFEMAGATLLVGGVANGRLQFLRSGPALFLGAISYPFYLMHWLGLAAANALMGYAVWEQPFLRVAVLAALSVSLTIPVAWLLHVGVENPVLRGRPRLRWGSAGPSMRVSEHASRRV